MRYHPALDGIRALAVLAVIAFHAGAPRMAGGFYWVEVFFVLSGYLITSLLRDELQHSGRVSLSRFYVRRALRLYPTLLLVVGAVLAAAPLWPGRDLVHEGLVALLYLSDYSLALFHEPLVLSHTWSLAVEEHFYLLWPLVLPWLLSRRDPARLLLRGYALAVMWLAINGTLLGEWHYTRFDTRLGGLLLGGWLALVRLPHLPRWAGWLALVLLGAITVAGVSGPVVFVLVDACACVLIVAALQASGPARLLASRALAYVGKLSYGLYLWHWPVCCWLVYEQRCDWVVTLVAAGALSFALAAATYHLVDVPLGRASKRARGQGRALLLKTGA